jgi:ketosteroid isomerase-like protein
MKTHIRTLGIARSLGLAACGGGAAAGWDPAASAALRAEPEALLHDLDQGRFDAMLAKMDDDSIVLDLDENNRPVRYQGRANVTEYFRALANAAKAQGLVFRSTIARDDCQATPAIGYCVVEFDQTITARGQTMGPFKFRASLVAHKVGSDWRVSHWHGSFREAPSATP